MTISTVDSVKRFAIQTILNSGDPDPAKLRYFANSSLDELLYTVKELLEKLHNREVRIRDLEMQIRNLEDNLLGAKR